TIRYTIDIQAFVGANTAYVGFGGGTGGLAVVQEVRTWFFMGTADRPPAPYSIFAAPYSSPRQILVTWAELSPTETGFQLERSTDGSNFTRIADLPFNVTSYADTPPQPGTYFYRVRAISDAGNSNYATTGPVAFLAPLAPSNLRALQSGPAQVNLSWLNNDFALTYTGIRIERSVGDDMHFAPLTTLIS